ncbi:MAG: glycosyltransferase family 8 protein, partial [Clostridia bacterium]|nr:glycosyltransferase family 8 protein [Clostridia bacterium]
MTKKILEKISNKSKEIIPIFFASDDNYLPCLSVALRSMINNASKDYNYKIYILNNGVSKDKADIILRMQNENFEIMFVDVSEKIKPLIADLGLRDYYTVAIYFRLFIASMFKNLKKALYLDCDIVVLGDISKLYFTELGDNILGASPDQIIASRKVYRDYSEKALGLDYKKYFTSGILVMNLDAYREHEIEKNFVSLLKKYNFNTIAPDQDYLNFLCKGKTKYIDISWNKHCLRDGYNKKPNIVHYAFFKKPWTDYFIKFERFFWQYAKKVEFYDYLVNFRKEFKLTKRISNEVAIQKLERKARDIYKSDYNFHKILEKPFDKKEKMVEYSENDEDIFNIDNEVCLN